MKAFALFVSVFLLSSYSWAEKSKDPRVKIYPLGKDSRHHAKAPRGKIIPFRMDKSQYYPRTSRLYWLYVPAQYKDDGSAALMVFTDGGVYKDLDGTFKAPIVLDNLIAQKRIPVTLAVFVNPSHRGADGPFEMPYRNNFRMREYDEVSQLFSDFLINELLPEVAAKYPFSNKAKMHALVGRSSGGAGVFTAAWQRPDYFHKVMSHNGSFTNIIGAHQYPSWIRKSAKKDIKVYLQASKYDLNNRHGNWYLSNLQMASALEWAGYDYRLDIAEDEHNSTFGGAKLPETLEWLWSDVNSAR